MPLPPPRPREPIGCSEDSSLSVLRGSPVCAAAPSSHFGGQPPVEFSGQKTVRRSRRAGRDEGGIRTLRRSAGGCTKRLGAAGTRGTMWKTASALAPHREDDPG